MDELEQYDLGAQRFYSSQRIKSLPISSWDISGHFFDKCCLGSKDISMVLQLASAHKWTAKLELNKALLHEEQVIIVTDAQLRIVHASYNMTDMNGYTPQEVIGRTPKMFQGEATSQNTRKQISSAIQRKSPFEAVILNYRKDGSTYNCRIKAEPLFNESGEVVHFIAYEKEVA